MKSCSPALPFEYDLERIIDDFILLNIFVGNDFLPHLPGLHINDGALGRLFEIYKKILPHAGTFSSGYKFFSPKTYAVFHKGGYLNEHGILNVKRLQLVLDELTVFEMEHFEHDFADSNWFKGKQTKHIESMEKARARNKLGSLPSWTLRLTSTLLMTAFLRQSLRKSNENCSSLSKPSSKRISTISLPIRDLLFRISFSQEIVVL